MRKNILLSQLISSVTQKKERIQGRKKAKTYLAMILLFMYFSILSFCFIKLLFTYSFVHFFPVASIHTIFFISFLFFFIIAFPFSFSFVLWNSNFTQAVDCKRLQVKWKYWVVRHCTDSVMEWAKNMERKKERKKKTERHGMLGWLIMRVVK